MPFYVMPDLPRASCKSPAAFHHGHQGTQQIINSKCPINILYRCGHCLIVCGCVAPYSQETHNFVKGIIPSSQLQFPLNLFDFQ